MKKRTSNKQQILDHLKKYGTITPMEALRLYGCYRTAARIGELRKEGHEIKTHLIQREDKYAKYQLIKGLD